MCGIAFFLNYGQKKINVDMVKGVHANLEARGRDSAGWYFERKTKDGSYTRKILKNRGIASDLWEDVGKGDKLSDFRITGEERLIILHTRSMTTGSEKDNNNNHPLLSTNFVLVHNGVIYTDEKEIKGGYQRKGEVDSELILAVLENGAMKKGVFEEKSIAESLEKISGSMSIIFKEIKGDCLYLYRNSNPLDLVYMSDMDMLVGISVDTYLDGYIEDKSKDLGGGLFFPSNIRRGKTERDTIYRVSMKEKKIEVVSTAVVPSYKMAVSNYPKEYLFPEEREGWRKKNEKR